MLRCLFQLGVSLAFCLGLTAPCHAQFRQLTPNLEQFGDRAMFASGYALGNVIFITTQDGVVVVDTTENPLIAEQINKDFQKRCTLPVSHIIYTHHHGDHVNGAKAFFRQGVEVIAQDLHRREMGTFILLTGYNAKLNSIQWGSNLPENQRGIVLSLDPRNPVRGYIPPTLLFGEEHKFTAGGVDIELYHTEGETFDHLMVWLPKERILMPGDLFYPCYPMLASPMKPNRPLLGWAESLERMRKLKPALLLPSHGLPVRGEQEVDQTLANYAQAIRFVHDETVKRLNKGMPVHQIRAEVKLPDELAKLPYLQPMYGTVEWGVNGVVRNYTGWYDMNPTHLNSVGTEERSRLLVEAAGGPQAVMAKVLAAKENPQLVLELTDVVLEAAPDFAPAHAARAEALMLLAQRAVNPVTVNVYRGAAQRHREAANKQPEAAK